MAGFNYYGLVNVEPEFETYGSTLDQASNEYDPSLVALPDGDFLLVYTSQSTTAQMPYNIVQEAYSGTGNEDFSEPYETLNFTRDVPVDQARSAQLANGKVITTWTQPGGTSPGIHYSMSNAGEIILTYDTLLPGTGANDSAGDIAALRTGGFAVVKQNFLSANDINADLLVFDANGAAVVSWALGNHSTSNEVAPTIAVLKNGRIVVAYQKEQTDGSGTYSMALEMYSADGETQIKGQTIFDSVGTQNVEPDVVALKDGGFAIAYSDNGGGTNGLTVAFFNSAGIFRGFVRADNDSGLDSSPSMSLLANGFVAVSWTSLINVNETAITTSVIDPASLTKVIGPYSFATQSGGYDTSIAGLTDGTQVTAWTDDTDPQGTQLALQIDSIVRYTFPGAATLRGDGLRDVIYSGDGSRDTFVYALGGNADTFNFVAGSASHDVIILSGFRDVHSFADVLAHTTQRGSGGTVIDFGGSDTLSLGAAKASLTADDFSFNTFDSTLSLAIPNFGASAGAGGWFSDNVLHRTLADVNGDGRADIVGFGYNSTLVSLANTAGGFDAPITGVNSFGYSAAGGGWSTETQYPRTAADVNGDGMADLVGFGYGGTFVALATGGGQFADPMLSTTAFGSSAAAGGWSEDNTYHRDVADVNGDGLADLVGFGYDGTYVALATGGGNFAAPVLSSTTFGSSAAAGGWSDDNIYHRELADVNGDGMADIVGFGSDTTYVALATGGGHFADAITALNGFGSSVAGGSWSDQTTYTRHLADINGDGMADIVGFGYNGVVTAYGNPDGTFQPAQTDIAAFGASSAAGGWSSNDLYPRLLSDVDGGGAADIVGFGSGGVYVAHSNVNWVG